MMIEQKKNEKIEMPEKPLGKESAFGPASRYLWKLILVMIFFTIALWIIRAIAELS